MNFHSSLAGLLVISCVFTFYISSSLYDKEVISKILAESQ